MKLLISGLLSIVAVSALNASSIEERLAALEEQNQQLIEEIAGMQSDVESDGVQSFTGLGTAASKVYRSKSKLSIGGYGVMNYVNQEGKAPVTDLYRFIPYIGYRFSDNIIMNTEIEFEHGGKESDGGYGIVEFSYLDFLIHKNFNVRVGHLLVPVGNVNLKHEPINFLGVNRPQTEKYIIPSTWHHNGLMAFGQISENIEYQAGIIDSLDGTDIGGGTRSARQGGRNKSANNFSMVARIDYKDVDNGLEAGVSFLNGKFNEDTTATLVGIEDESITLVDIHANYKANGVEAKFLLVSSTVSDKDLIGYEGSEGMYLTVGYDIMPLISSDSNSQMLPFLRYENYDKLIQSGQDDAVTNITAGVNYRPHSNVVVKADYVTTKVKNADDNHAVELGLGYLF
jgi:opacity protein-like surface antigen